MFDKRFLKENLINLRKKNNLTQKNVSDYLGISRTNYAYFEINDLVPDIDIICKLCKFYNVNIEWLLGFKASGGNIYGHNYDKAN